MSFREAAILIFSHWLAGLGEPQLRCRHLERPSGLRPRAAMAAAWSAKLPPAQAMRAPADTGACSSSYDTCEGDPNCMSYSACLQGCASGDTTCTSNCASTYATGYSEYLNYADCLCFTACTTQCASACSSL